LRPISVRSVGIVGIVDAEPFPSGIWLEDKAIVRKPIFHPTVHLPGHVVLPPACACPHVNYDGTRMDSRAGVPRNGERVPSIAGTPDGDSLGAGTTVGAVLVQTKVS